MKTLTRIFAALFALAAIAACRGEEGPMGPMGPRGPQGPKGEDGAGTNWEVIEYEIPAGAWVYNQEMGDPERGYWAYSAECPEITEEIYKIGIITAYVMAPDFQSALPYSRFYYETDANGGDPILWEVRIDCEFQVGAVNFYITDNDFFLEEAADYKFKVAMIW